MKHGIQRDYLLSYSLSFFTVFIYIGFRIVVRRIQNIYYYTRPSYYLELIDELVVLITRTRLDPIPPWSLAYSTPYFIVPPFTNSIKNPSICL